MSSKRLVDLSDYHKAKDSERAALLDDSNDDDDFFLRGPNAQPNRLSRDPKVARLQGQVDEVIDVMQDNIGKVMDRGQRLEELHDKSEDLSSNADLFRVKARGLKTHMWWRECRMRIILAVIILVILAIIFIPIIVSQTRKGS